VPLSELFDVTHRSPQYNEREHRGVFYAESWAPAHYLLGVVELKHRDNLAQAAQHFRTAMQLDPENKQYLLALGDLQIQRREYATARQTLLSLLGPEIDPEVRRKAESLMKALEESIRP